MEPGEEPAPAPDNVVFAVDRDGFTKVGSKGKPIKTKVVLSDYLTKDIFRGLNAVSAVDSNSESLSAPAAGPADRSIASRRPRAVLLKCRKSARRNRHGRAGPGERLFLPSWLERWLLEPELRTQRQSPTGSPRK